MSFTDSDYELIRKHLGYQATQPNMTRIIVRCAEAAALSTAVVTTVRGYLTDLERIEKQITQTRPFAAQSFNSGASGTQQYVPGERLGVLKSEAERLVNLVAQTLQLDVRSNVYTNGRSTGRVYR